MTKEQINASVDVGIRFATIIIRGVFIFAAAKYLNEVNFGLYVAVTAVISLVQYAVAGDFSYIAHREYFSNRIKFDEIIKTQALVLGTLFLLSTPIALILMPEGLGIISVTLALYILLFESLTSELQRHLVAISKFTTANIMLFMKSAGWMLPTLVIFKNINKIELMHLLYAWVLGLTVSALLGIISLRSYLSISAKSNINLIKLYLSKVMLILFGTLATRSLFSIDRTIVEKYIGIEEAGIYGIFVGVAAGFVAIVDSGILARTYPNLINAIPLKNGEFEKIKNKVNLRIIIATTFAIIVYLLLIDVFLNILSKPNYLQHGSCGIVLIIAYGIYSLSYPLNCWLYVNNKDKEITAINIFSMIPILFYSTASQITMIGVSISILICACAHYLIRILYIKK